MPVELSNIHVKLKLSENRPVSVQATGLKISNAGMVLLHPFVEKIFVELCLISDSAFIDDACRCRGAYIWAYTASGYENYSDLDLLLPGLLCGVSPESADYTGFTISEFEKEICNRHLCRVLKYWDLARNLETLRCNFLRRVGVLEQSNGYWTLQIEEDKADDLAEGSFQSPIRIFRSWQKEPLIVYWQ